MGDAQMSGENARRLRRRTAGTVAAVVVIDIACVFVLGPVAAGWALVGAEVLAVLVAVSLIWLVDGDNRWVYLAAVLLAVCPLASHDAARDVAASIGVRQPCTIASVQGRAGQLAGVAATSFVHELRCAGGVGRQELALDSALGAAGERIQVWWNPDARSALLPVDGAQAPRPWLWGPVTGLLLIGLLASAVGVSRTAGPAESARPPGPAGPA